MTILKAKLGIAPIAWWNDDLAELSDDVSLEECLRITSTVSPEPKAVSAHGESASIPKRLGTKPSVLSKSPRMEADVSGGLVYTVNKNSIAQKPNRNGCRVTGMSTGRVLPSPS